MLRVYDFESETYRVIEGESGIPLGWICGSCDLVLVKVGRGGESVGVSGSASQEGQKLSETSSVKKERSKERVIFEVIEIVKKWRELHQSRNSLKKISLLQAAKMLNTPKKSLDDYYYQLRLGEKHGFDFENHLFDRVGVLRTYLKNHKAHSSIDKYEKHPKNLRIIDQFDQISEIFYNAKNNSLRNTNLEMEQEVADNFFNEDDDQADNHGINNFGSEFEYLLDEKDPFLMGDYNFKKKSNGQLDDD